MMRWTKKHGMPILLLILSFFLVFFSRGKRGFFGGELSFQLVLLPLPEIDLPEIVFFSQEEALWFYIFFSKSQN